MVKIEVKKIDVTKRELDIEVIGDRVKNSFEEVFKRIGKEAKVKGFRQGSVPRDILEKEFSSLANEQVLKELIPDVYNEAVKKEGLDVVGLPDVTDVKLERSSLQFKATVDILPEIKLKEYKKIKITYRKPQASADEVRRHLDSIKESRKAEAIDDNLAKSLGYPDLSELEDAIRRQILAQKDSLQIRNIEGEIIEHITKDLEVKLPHSLVSRQLQNMVRQAKVDLAIKGMPQEQVGAQEEKLLKELEPEAKRQVKVYLILSDIAKKENIPQDDNMARNVVELLLKKADWKIEQTN